jgi:hypothetical protein
MLYLHCGWQRTGTSSLQAALCRHQERLRAAGILYPERWRPPGSDAHFAIAELLEDPGGGKAAIDGFKDYLRTRADGTVLLSCEGLSNWLLAERRSSLQRLVAAARETTPVTLIWTLRSVDTLLTSLYLHRVATARPLPSPANFFHDFSDLLAEIVASMCHLADAVGGNASYGRYDGGGGHYAEILGVVGTPDPLREEIVGELRHGPRANVSLGRKGVVLLLHTEAIEDRLGARLQRQALRTALRSGELRLEGDAHCELVEPEVRRAVHENALGASRDLGFDPYIDLFADHEVSPAPAASLDPDALTDEDLDALRAWLPSSRDFTPGEEGFRRLTSPGPGL